MAFVDFQLHKDFIVPLKAWFYVYLYFACVYVIPEFINLLKNDSMNIAKNAVLRNCSSDTISQDACKTAKQTNVIELSS